MTDNSSASAAHKDSTSNINDGDQINNNEVSAQIWLGQDFEGNIQDEFVEIPNSSSLENVQESDYSIEAWFNPDQVPPGSGPDNDAYYGIVTKEGNHLGLAYSNAGTFTMLHYGSGPVDLSVDGVTAAGPGSYHHVVGVISKTNGEVKIYVNGTLDGTNAFAPGTPAYEYGTVPWRIGIAEPGAGFRRWPADGKIDEVRISDRPLSDDWVITSFNSQSSPLSFYSVGSEEAVGSCPPLTTTKAPGTITVTTPDSFELRFNSVRGGSIDEWFELDRDPDRSENLVNNLGDGSTYGLNDFEVGTFQINQTSHARLYLLEATPIRAVVRTEGFLGNDGGRPYSQATTVYGRGAFFNQFVFSNDSGAAVDHILNWYNGSDYSPEWKGLTATEGVLDDATEPHSFDEAWALKYVIDSPADEHYGNLLFIPSRDYTEFSASGWQWKNNDPDGGYIKLTSQPTKLNIAAGESKTFIGSTVLKPDSIESDTEAQPFAEDYRNPDGLIISVGDPWNDPVENTGADPYNEAQGVYTPGYASNERFDV